MSDEFTTLSEEEGVVERSAEFSAFRIADVRFPPSYVQAPFEPDLPYAAFVLDGGLAKSFRSRAMELAGGCAVSMPAGAWHGARFGTTGARIVIVKSTSASSAAGASLGSLAQLRSRGLTWLAWRLAGELGASDAAAPLAAEGYAFELLAAANREATPERRRGRPPAWLARAEELLRVPGPEAIRLGELAEAVGVHPAHLARAFRARHGVSVGEYGRRVRVERAAAEVARGELPLAAIAAGAGFADQSHFTRVFARHVGTTPARYRHEMRASGIPN